MKKIKSLKNKNKRALHRFAADVYYHFHMFVYCKKKQCHHSEKENRNNNNKDDDWERKKLAKS